MSGFCGLHNLPNELRRLARWTLFLGVVALAALLYWIG